MINGKDVKMKRVITSLSLVMIMGFAGCSSPSNPQAEAAAVTAAQAWLSLVDSEKYTESWEDAAQFFKGAVAKEQWIQAMQSGRKPFGKNISRELKSTRYRTTMPGAPDGEYVIIQFTASFENKKSAVETITPMLDKDGKWRVSGYYMK
jgi:hypothetical protein